MATIATRISPAAFANEIGRRSASRPVPPAIATTIPSTTASWTTPPTAVDHS
jgi:hypothetical protein